ncbi:ABC transporter permease [Rossellomorea marisflavi]|uniref:ABC transporter permease n=1 Tax=Rossellomorea marisflavi TaxID=189381 RepID=UPI003ADCDC0B
MKNTWTVFKKESRQMGLEYKWIWLPVVFILLGATQPVTSYYLPSILEMMGGEQGITVDPSKFVLDGNTILAATLASQFDQMGLIIIALSFMGIIQGEKASGMLSFMMTRPLNLRSYLLGKWVAAFSLIAFSMMAGFGTSMFYSHYLFDGVNVVIGIKAFSIYLVWGMFILSVIMTVSTLLRGSGSVAFVSIVTLLLFRMLAGLNPLVDLFNPASLSLEAANVLKTSGMMSGITWTFLLVAVWILFLFSLNEWLIKHRKVYLRHG